MTEDWDVNPEEEIIPHLEQGDIEWVSPTAISDEHTILSLESVWKLNRQKGKDEGVLIGWDESRCMFYMRSLTVPKELAPPPWDGTLEELG